MAITQKGFYFQGLSGDTKPITGISVNDLFLETDTRKWYLWTGGAWLALPTGGTETIEKYADAVLGVGATYTPAASGIFFGHDKFASLAPQYYSTVANAWYSPMAVTQLNTFTAIGDGTNFRIRQDANVSEYILFRHFYSTATYERYRDAQLPALGTYTPAVAGFFAQGVENNSVRIELQLTVAGWDTIQEAFTNGPGTILVGDGTNLRARNGNGVNAYYHVMMRAKLT